MKKYMKKLSHIVSLIQLCSFVFADVVTIFAFYSHYALHPRPKPAFAHWLAGECTQSRDTVNG